MRHWATEYFEKYAAWYHHPVVAKPLLAGLMLHNAAKGGSDLPMLPDRQVRMRPSLASSPPLRPVLSPALTSIR